MAMIHLLKMLSDTAAYYAFAAPVAVHFGGGGLLVSAMLQCFAYSIARIAKKPWLRLLLLAPIAVCYVLHRDAPADLIALTPATGYILWQALREGPAPELYQQRELLESCWKLLVPAVITALLFSGIGAALPFLLIFLISSVALLRTLRHSPEVYLRPRFHLMNFAAMAVVPAGAVVLGSDAVTNACAALLGSLYRNVLVPLLMALLWVPMMAVQWLINLLAPLFSQTQEDEENLSELITATEAPRDSTQWDPGANPALSAIFWAALAVAVIAALVLLFRWLITRKKTAADTAFSQEARTVITPEKAEPLSFGNSPVQSIRRHYRRFLKLCQTKGIVRTGGTTSRDIDERARTDPGLGLHSGRIRQLYIRARYAGRATKEDAREMGRLCAETKKKL